jgi:hypothetical protein
MIKTSKPYIPFENIHYCGAKTRTTEKPCRGSAMPNGRCRFHGGLSTGRPVTTGLWTKEAMLHRKRVNAQIRQVKDVLEL